MKRVWRSKERKHWTSLVRCILSLIDNRPCYTPSLNLYFFQYPNRRLIHERNIILHMSFCRPGVDIGKTSTWTLHCTTAFEQGSLSCRACCDTGHLFPWPPDLVAYRKKNWNWYLDLFWSFATSEMIFTKYGTIDGCKSVI